MSTLAYLTLFLSMCLTAHALNCYKCEDCSGKLSYITTGGECSSAAINLGAITEPRCFKQITSDGVINRGCLSQGECLAKELVGKCTDGDLGCYTCCTDNKCNSASIATVSMVTMLVSTLLALLHLL